MFGFRRPRTQEIGTARVAVAGPPSPRAGFMEMRNQAGVNAVNPPVATYLTSA
jgi:hypothetical protein